MDKRQLRLCFLLVPAILMLASCDHTEERSISGVPPIVEARITTFRAIRWLSTPSQTIRVQVNQDSDVNRLIDPALFDGFEPGMTDEQALARFGEPALKRTDDFGGSWSKYPTSLGYVELGWDRRTSPANGEEGAKSTEGRRSLRAFTDHRPEDVFRLPLQSVIKTSEQLAPKVERREVRVFDSGGNLVLNFWLTGIKVDFFELFRQPSDTK